MIITFSQGPESSVTSSVVQLGKPYLSPTLEATWSIDVDWPDAGMVRSPIYGTDPLNALENALTLIKSFVEAKRNVGKVFNVVEVSFQ